MLLASAPVFALDISNTARESRMAVTRCVQDLEWTKQARKLDPNADLVWIDRALPVRKFYLQRLGANRRTYQRANRFFGMDSIVTKCALAQALEALESLQQACCEITTDTRTENVQKKEEKVDRDVENDCSSSLETTSKATTLCMPRSWCFPRDCIIFEGEDPATLNQSSSMPSCWYIAKPDRGRCGRGIALFPSRNQVLSAFRAGELSEENSNTSSASKKTTDNHNSPSPPAVVVQEYIPDPLLFRETGCKFDLRVYVLIKSLTPLKLLIFDEGLVRVASTTYQAPTPSNCQTATMHLTNSHINSKVTGISQQDLRTTAAAAAAAAVTMQMTEMVVENIPVELKHCITTTLQWISKQHNVPAEEIWGRICQSVATAIVAVYPSAALAHSTCFAPNREEHANRCFQLLGVDVLLDSALRPWVLEINNSPSLNLSTSADEAIKVPLIKSLLVEVFEHNNTATVLSDQTTITTTAKWGEQGYVPNFQHFDVTKVKCNSGKECAVEVQTKILDVYRRLCGWKASSCRPVKSMMPSKEMWLKVTKKNLTLPPLKDLSLHSFIQWIAKQSSASSSSSMSNVIKMLNEALV
jgi:hypothetical protein